MTNDGSHNLHKEKNVKGKKSFPVTNLLKLWGHSFPLHLSLYFLNLLTLLPLIVIRSLTSLSPDYHRSPKSILKNTWPSSCSAASLMAISLNSRKIIYWEMKIFIPSIGPTHYSSDGWTNEPTRRPTDRATYWAACPRLKSQIKLC